MSTPTAPIPNRLPAPNPAPNRPSECPRCGTPAISTRGVGAHDLWHRQQDERNRRLERVLAALEDMLAAFDGDPSDDPDDGEPKTFRAWVAETDHILDTLAAQLEELRQPAPAGDAAAPEIEVLPWPGNPGPGPEEDETVEPDDTDPAVIALGLLASGADRALASVALEDPHPEDVAAIDDDLDRDYIDHPASPQARY